MIVAISRYPAKCSKMPEEGVGWAHSTFDGKDNITLSEGGSPALLVCPKEVSVRECLVRGLKGRCLKKRVE